MPIAWMICSNATEVTIDYFITRIQALSPNIIPRIWMSDADRAQMNVIRRRYVQSLLFLCWWHVLHAWQQHFSIEQYPELWELLKRWIRITDENEFEVQWVKIRSVAPPSVIEYLQTNWLVEQHLWSAVSRKNRHVFEEGDTNMLVEAYVWSYLWN
jgi:hypothetical protein